MTTSNTSLMLFFKKVCLAVINTALFVPVLQLFMQLNDLTASRALLFYVPFVQVIFILLPKWLFWLPVQLMVSGYTVYRYFPLQESFGLDWLRSFAAALSPSLQSLRGNETTIFPNILSLLLFVLIVFISSWFLISMLNPYVSFFSTLGYLLILQVFTTTDLFQTVVSTLLFGILLVGTAHIPITGTLKNALLSLLLLSVSGFLFVRVSIWGTRQFSEQQAWTISQADNYHQSLENNGFFEWVNDHSPGGTSVRSGFSENDSELGGPLTQRYNTVFKAFTPNPQYWFIEAKEIYTGKGWETREENLIDIDLAIYESFSPEATNLETEQIPIQLSESFDYFPYAYQTVAFDFPESSEQISFQLELPTEQYLIAGGGPHDVENYTLTTVPMEFNPDASQASYTAEVMGEEGFNRYTQLPETLPQRVIDLANSLTEGLSTQYEKVRAIENYLKAEGGFQYSTSETPFVPVEQDYVDSFLFDSKIGYCDNFSTAMVILSRAASIPARWAKGFNSGDEVRNGEETYYEITNANAHSWPEVYFGEAGWVPFEPTPPFNQPMTAEIADEQEADDALTPEEESEAQNSSAPESSESSERTESEVAESESADMGQSNAFNRSVGWMIAVLLTAGLGVVAFLNRWALVILTVRKLLQTHLFNLEQQTTIVNQLFKWQKKPQPGQTLRHYFEQWIPLVPEQETTIQQYIQLLETMRYAPPSRTVTETSETKKQVFDMVNVIELLQQQIKKSVSS